MGNNVWIKIKDKKPEENRFMLVRCVYNDIYKGVNFEFNYYIGVLINGCLYLGNQECTLIDKSVNSKFYTEFEWKYIEE